MPRPPVISHPLRELRRHLGVSQAAFGQLIGVSPHTILSVENGRLKMSERLARRIEAVSGADAAELRKGLDGRLINRRGRPYTRADFEAWVGSAASSLGASPDQLAIKLASQIKTLLQRAHAKAKLPLVYQRILEALDEGKSLLR